MLAASGPTRFERTLWAQTAAPFDADGPLSGSTKADVVIIGAGFSGLSAALHLAEAGRSAVVIEAYAPGTGATGRNAGGWLPQYLDRTPEEVERLLGRQRGDALNRMMAEGGELVTELAERNSIAADIRRSGILVCSGNPKDAETLVKQQAQWNARGGNVEVIDAARLHTVTGTAAFKCGLLYRSAGTLNPLAYARGLAAAARRAGASIHCGNAARRILPQRGGWRVETAQGSVDARHVLIATEGYATDNALWPGLDTTYYRLPMAVIASRPDTEIARRLLPAGIPIADVNKTNPFWAMADSEGRIVGSLLPPRSDALTPMQAAAAYEAKLRRIYRDLPPIEWTHFWIGTIAVSAERIARLLRLADGVHAIGGYSGQGIAAAIASGREYARLVDGADDPDACRLPIIEPARVPLRRLLSRVFRSVVAPLGRTLDRSYR